MLIRQKGSYLLTKLVKMLRAEERRPEDERDQELIATIVAIENDRDKLVSKLERAVDKGNAAALVSFLVFDAVADVKFHTGHFRCSVIEAPAWNRRTLVC